MDCRQLDGWDNRWVYVLDKDNIYKLSMQAKNIDKIWLIGEIFKILIKSKIIKEWNII